MSNEMRACVSLDYSFRLFLKVEHNTLFYFMRVCVCVNPLGCKDFLKNFRDALKRQCHVPPPVCASAKIFNEKISKKETKKNG